MTDDNDVVELMIDSLASGGEGVGRDASGRVTFVPRTVPGDRVRARLTVKKKSFARASLLALVTPSPHRVEAPCRLFAEDKCGGCQWQEVSAEQQAHSKTDIVASALRRAVAEGLEIKPIVSPVAPYGWRRRARLHWFRSATSDRALVGLFAPRSRFVVEVRQCPQFEPALELAVASVYQILAPSLHRRGEIELLVGDRGTVVSIHGPCNPRVASRLVGQGGIVGVKLGGHSWGEAAVPLDGGPPVAADSFAQASANGNHALVSAVLAATGDLSGKRVVEFFAGHGNFTRLLAEAGASVLAVDRTVPSPPPPWPGVTFRAGDCAEVVVSLAEAETSFDTVLLDPPRTGAAEVVATVPRLFPKRIVYVSCDPATLARDLDPLINAGYKPQSAVPLDLMPQTSHVEVVVTLDATS